MPFEEEFRANVTIKSRTLQNHLYFLLNNCKSLKHLSQIHSQIFVNGFSQKSFLLVKLLSFYVLSSDVSSALAVFNNTLNPSPSVWNQVIRGFGQSENPRLAVELLNQMAVAEARPSGFTYSFVLSGCARSGLVREGEQIHGRVLANGYCSNVFVMTHLINLYAMGRGDSSVKRALRVFDEMSERSVSSWNSLLAAYTRRGSVDEARMIFDEMPERNVVSWTTMLAAYAQNGRCKEALSLFNLLRKAHVELDQVVLSAALSACAELGDLQLGRWIHLYIIKKLSSTDPSLVRLNNALLHMYASCGEIEESYEILRCMLHRSTVSWTSMIIAFVKHGYAQEAIAMFQLMQSFGTDDAKPDAITFLGVLSACSHVGSVIEGCQFFKEMIKSWGIKPSIKHYECMVDLLSRAGFLDEALVLIKNMPMKPNDVIWGAILGGCRIHKNNALASHLAQKFIIELDPKRASSFIVLFSNVYASAKGWCDLASIRQMIASMDVSKPTGQSSIQINGKVHEFLAEETHEHVSFIYEMVGMITREAKSAYQPDLLEVYS